MEDDKRKYLRFECLIPIDLMEIDDSISDHKEALIDNVSREGIRLVFDLGRAFREGDSLSFQIQNPDEKRTCRMTGEVVWARPLGKKVEVGLRIKNMERCSKSELLDMGYNAWRKHQKDIDKDAAIDGRKK
ncbi:MAG: PilZ domain-containing protein [Candidatus Aminicenantales bacterium]